MARRLVVASGGVEVGISEVLMVSMGGGRVEPTPLLLK